MKRAKAVRISHVSAESETRPERSFNQGYQWIDPWSLGDRLLKTG